MLTVLKTADTYKLGLINTAYTIGAIIAGFFIGGPTVRCDPCRGGGVHLSCADAGHQADYLGRRWGMGIGCLVTIVATFMQAFAPRGNLGCFIGGRVLVGVGQGMALSECPVRHGRAA